MLCPRLERGQGRNEGALIVHKVASRLPTRLAVLSPLSCPKQRLCTRQVGSVVLTELSAVYSAIRCARMCLTVPVA